MKSHILAVLASFALTLPAQTISTIAGGSATAPGDGGAANLAFLNRPFGLALTQKASGSVPAGSLVIADQLDNRIRVVTPNGIISTVAGAGPAGFLDGPAATAQFFNPSYVRPDSNGNIYVSDLFNYRVRKIDSSGNVTTIAGIGKSQDGPDNTAATSSGFLSVYGIAIDNNGTLYVADALANRIRRIDANGQISTFGGNGTPGFGGDGAGVSQSVLNSPVGLVFDSNKGDLYIADSSNGRIRKVNSAGVISTLMGCGTAAPDANCPSVTTLASGTQITPPTKARLFNPQSMSVGPDGIYVVDVLQTQSGNLSVIYRVDFAGTTATIIGAVTGQIADLVALGTTQIYVSEGSVSRTVQLVTGAGPRTYAGGGLFDGASALAIGIIGPPPATLVPAGIKTDNAGNIYFSDYGENVVRKIDINGKVSTVAGNGLFATGGENIPAVQASLAGPLGLEFDSQGNLYIAEALASKIRKVTPSGIITTYAGTGGRGFSGDGGPATAAALSIPTALAFDPTTNSMFISDNGTFPLIAGSDRIRKVDGAGNISTYAGQGYPANFQPCLNQVSYSCGDGGPATSATLGAPVDIAVDPGGNLYILERYLQVSISTAIPGAKIRKVDATTKNISTIAGNGNFDTGGEGGGALQASLGTPAGLTIDKNSGALFVSDDRNHRILKVTSNVTRIAGNDTKGGFTGDGSPAINAAINRPEGMSLDNSGSLVFWDAGNNRLRKITTVGGTTARALVKIDGNQQSGPISTVLPKNVTVKVLDGVNPVSGVTVTFTVNPAGAATLNPTTAVSDNTGSAFTQVTLGPAAAKFTVSAAATGLATLTFDETAQSTLGGVAQGASFANNGSLAPGTIGSLFGTGLAATTDAASFTPLPTKLSTDTSLKVTFGTTTLSAPLFFASPGQVNFLLPFEVTASSVNLVLSAGGVDTVAFPLGVTDTAPGIFTKNSQGTGLGAVLHGLTFQPVTTANPAKPGEIVSVFCAGLGAVAPTVPSGVATPSDQLYRTTGTITASVGGASASVDFSGLAQGFVGLYQVNVILPANVAPGAAVSLVIGANNRTSNTATIPVAAP